MQPRDPAGGGRGSQDEPRRVSPLLNFAASRTIVGRERELSTLLQVCKGVESGTGGVVLVSGEPGIGKTALARQLIDVVSASGWLHLEGQSSLHGGAVPYLPFAEAVRRYLSEMDLSHLRARLGDHVEALEPVAPALRRERSADLTARVTVEEERVRFMEAVHALLADATERQPVLLLIEDLHDTDAGSLDLLVYLARRINRQRLLVLGTYRDTEAQREPLASALASLGGAPVLARLGLRGLATESVQALLVDLARRPVDDGLSDLVHRQTEGNPLFIQELIRFLDDEQLVAERDDRLVLATPGASTLPVPDGVRSAIGGRLARLDGEHLRLLETAAVIGREFDADELREAADVSETVLDSALDEAIRESVITDASERGRLRYRFAHALFRQTLYEGILSTRRARAHVEIAQIIERRNGERADEHAPRLAQHYSYSRDDDGIGRAVRYAELAGEQAATAFGHGEAVSWFERAIEWQGARDQTNSQLLGRLHLQLARALTARGHAMRALEAAEKAFELGQVAANDGLAIEAAVVAIEAIRASSESEQWRRLSSPAFFAWTERAERLAEPGTRAHVSIQPYVAIRRLFQAGDRLAFWVAVDVARAFGDEDLLLDAGDAALAFTGGPELEERRRALFEELRDDDRVAAHDGGLTGRFGAAIEFGDRARADRYLAEAERWAQRTDHVEHASAARAMRMNLEYIDGNVARVRELFERHVDDAVGGGARMRSAATRAYLYAGVFDRRLYLGGRFPLSFPALVRHGPGQEVSDMLERSLPRPNGPTARDVEDLEAAVAVGDRHRVEQLAALVERCSAPATGGGALATLLKRHLGDARALLGEPRRARELYEGALEDGAQLRFRPEIAMTRLSLGALLLEHFPNERREGEQHIEFALAECREMGLWPSVDRAERLLAGVDRPGDREAFTTKARTRETQSPAGLSPREIEVLQLVAEGLSNRQVAERLVVTESTAANHLHHAMTKTNTSTRTEAANWALRHGLLEGWGARGD